MNKDKFRDLCLNLSKKSGLSFNVVQTQYFLESILKRISMSRENKNFIFKGGFLLSNMIGIGQRSTVDIDFLINKFALTEDNILHKIQTILSYDEKEGVTYKVQKIEPIRHEDEYGGYRVTILCQLENIRQMVPLDIATGDPITPCEIAYEYKSLFSDEYFEICAYNIETILAEKIHTIFVRGIFNSRSKDFYDVYILYCLKYDEIDFKNLREACEKTFKHRGVNFSVSDILNVLGMLENEKELYIRWKAYQKRFPYALDIEFQNTIRAIKKLVQSIPLVFDRWL